MEYITLSTVHSPLCSGTSLEILSTIQEILGYLRIGPLTTLTSFPYLRNLKKIGFPGIALNVSIGGAMCPGKCMSYQCTSVCVPILNCGPPHNTHRCSVQSLHLHILIITLNTIRPPKHRPELPPTDPIWRLCAGQ